MRRAICLTEPKSVYAGSIGNWKFIYSPSITLTKGTLLKFDIASKGRDIDWQVPEIQNKQKKNLIWLELPNGKKITPSLVDVPNITVPQFEFELPAEVKMGEHLAIIMGSPEENLASTHGNQAQKILHRRRSFYLYVDPRGKREYKEPEVFGIDVKGNKLEYIKIIAPSIVGKNQRFDVIVRFEDAFGNLTNFAPEGTLIELSYEQLRENLSWKLFIPETGFITLPNLYFNESGIYRLQLKNLKSKEIFFSPPIKCFSEIEKMIYWGTFHGESERFDASEQIESALRHFRDDKDMHYYATSSFESEEETSSETWKNISNHVADFNEPDRFITFLGFQWEGAPGSEGLRHLIYLKDNKPILRKKDSKSNNLKKIYKMHSPKEILSIPSFTMGAGIYTDFSNFSPEHERVVEIYNAWGSSECPSEEGNPMPILTTGKKGMVEVKDGSIRSALNKNCRFGFISGGLDDRGIYSDFYDSDQKQYTPGLTAIFSSEQSRESIATALYDRSCYATTGPRIILGFTIAGMPMGNELSTKVKPGLLYNRHITGYVGGIDQIKEILIIRNGKPFKTFKPDNTDYFEFMIDDTDPLENISLDSPDERPPFTYYYLRAQQKDGNLAWASPIWIDYIKNQAVPVSVKKKKGK